VGLHVFELLPQAAPRAVVPMAAMTMM